MASREEQWRSSRKRERSRSRDAPSRTKETSSRRVCNCACNDEPLIEQGVDEPPEARVRCHCRLCGGTEGRCRITLTQVGALIQCWRTDLPVDRVVCFSCAGYD